MSKPINAARRVAVATSVLARLQAQLIEEWADLADRPLEAVDLGIGLELLLVDLRKLARTEAHDLDAMLASACRAKAVPS